MSKMIQWLPVLQYFIVPASILLSGMWVYWLVLVRRELEPAGELQIDLDFVGQQKGQWLIEVSAVLTNKSLVRHKYQDFHVVIRYLLPNDAVEDGEKTMYQLYCPHSINERIGGKVREFGDVSHINPRLSYRHSYITFIPSEATFVWLLCKLKFPTRHRWLKWKKKDERKSAQRFFKVPKDEIPVGNCSTESTGPQ